MRGIYYIENKQNGRWYIGQSKDIESRLQGHARDLAKNKHANIALQNDYNSGYDFHVNVLANVPQGNLYKIETEYIEYYANKVLLYNHPKHLSKEVLFKQRRLYAELKEPEVEYILNPWIETKELLWFSFMRSIITIRSALRSICIILKEFWPIGILIAFTYLVILAIGG